MTSPRRTSLLPDLPTVSEAGVPRYEVTVWYGVFAAAGTPSAVVRRLNAEFNKIVMMPEVTARFTALGAEPVATTPEAFGALVRSPMAARLQRNGHNETDWISRYISHFVGYVK